MAKQEGSVSKEQWDLSKLVGQNVLLKLQLTEGHCLADFTIQGELTFDGEIYEVEEGRGLVSFEFEDISDIMEFDGTHTISFSYV